MGVSERKARERESREEMILERARCMLASDGFQALNLDRLAEAIEYSKGTLYQHFESKEDIALAVATRALRERADLFEQAGRFEGRTRERMRAVGFACCEFAARHPDYFKIEMMLKGVSFWERASSRRREAHGLQALRAFRVGQAIVGEGLRNGDLPAGSLTAEEITFSLIAMTVGSHIMAREPDLARLAGIANPIEVVRRNQDLVCDGLGWRPLLQEWDYAATDLRIAAEIFPRSVWFPSSAAVGAASSGASTEGGGR